MNLIPQKSGTTPSYWCTWSTQSHGRTDDAKKDSAVDTAKFEGDQGARLARGYLNEEAIFGKHGWITQFPQIREDLYLLLDDGWDVAYGVHPDTQRYRFGSMELDVERFPSFSGNPAERLKKLNEKVKESGWRGVGLWVAAQAAGEGRDGFQMNDAELDVYWRERARWSHFAGVEYWKVDWGFHAHDVDFRRMLTRIVKEESPNLIVEQAYNCGPMNDVSTPWDTQECYDSGRFSKWGKILENSLKVLSFSDVFRSYDVTGYLSVPSTLDRVCDLLMGASMENNAKGIINCEEEPYIGATLGCSLGIMRSTFWNEVQGMNYDPFQLRKRMDEVVRAVRWQRMAPAFGGTELETLCSETILEDSWIFQKGDTWAGWVIGKEVRQGAPAVIARGMQLPLVESTGEAPFVIASQNPNGAVSIATMSRISAGKGINLPLADVSITLNEIGLVGIFGRYKTLRIQLPSAIGSRKILAQDLLGDDSVDITDKVFIEGHSLLLPGELIHTIGLLHASEGDLSEPGMVLRIL